uniref:Autotransporter domain-containing protein n=1 Tax=Caenorhabditis tropicalis TaxID=1561998 RepID=A0A1I7TJ41_9PELO
MLRELISILLSAVGSNAATDGNGDNVLTDATTQHFKTPDGTVAMNVTSNGNATGIGSSNIETSAGGNVGSSNVDNIANVMSVGAKSNSYSDIFAAVEGEKITSNVIQQGRVAGQGSTLSNVNGGSSMRNNNGERKNGFSFGNAGGTGSINTEADVQTQQAMSWDQLMARLMASASASGIGSAQSNLDIGTGSDDKNITISGLVSGLNSNEGTVNTLVKGNGIINGTDQNAVGTMYGLSSGKGNSSLVGASSIVSNQSSSLGEIQAFGNSNAFSSGNTSVNLMSNTNIEDEGGLGVVHIDGNGQGTDNYIVASNGLKFLNSDNDAAFMGTGNVKGIGSDENSKASQSVDTAVDPSGVVKIVAKSDGQSISHDGTNSSLTFNDNGLVGGWRNSSFGGFANGLGVASGQNTNVTGQGFVEMNGSSMNGNSSMQAFGTGNGPISADTKAVLNVVEDGVQRNGTVNGIAAADGTNTNVQSLSLISNIDGFEAVNNYQKVSSSGAGSSSVSASSSTIFKRKKRFSVLANILKK